MIQQRADILNAFFHGSIEISVTLKRSTESIGINYTQGC